MYFGKTRYQVVSEHFRNMVNRFLFLSDRQAPLSGTGWHRHVQRNRTIKIFDKEDCYARKRIFLSLHFTKSYYFYFQWKKGGRQKVKLGTSLISSSPTAMLLKPGVFCAVPGQMYVQSSWRLIMGIGWQLSAYVNVPLGPWHAANSHSREILIIVHFLLSVFSLAGCSAGILNCISAFVTETRQTTATSSVTKKKKSSSYGISSCAFCHRCYHPRFWSACFPEDLQEVTNSSL